MASDHLSVLISLVIIFEAPVILVFAFVQDFGNIIINERLVFVSIVRVIIGFGLLLFSMGDISST